MRFGRYELESNKEIIIDNVIEAKEPNLMHPDLRKITPVYVTGSGYLIDEENFIFTLKAEGVMTLPCAITLEDTEYPFSIDIEIKVALALEKDEDAYELVNNYIDIEPILWQNIIAEIPIKVVSPNAFKAKRSGGGWRLLTEDEFIDEIANLENDISND